MKMNNITVVTAVLLLASCGGSSGNNVNGYEDGGSEPVAMDISTDGGTLKLSGVAKLRFPQGSFDEMTNVIIQDKEVDESLNQLVSTLPSTPFNGQLYKDTVSILSPVQPNQDITIEYTIPNDFLQQLDPDSEPILVANIIQGGDEEQIDDFYDLKATISGNVLTAKLPPWVFSNDYPDTNDKYIATIILSSATKENSSTAESLKSLFLKSNVSCGGSSIGSPLEGDLVVKSSFGPRTHPILQRKKGHFGTDFKASTGDDVLAVADGVIQRVSYDYNPAKKTGYGWYIVILHQDGSKTLYAHLEKGSTDDIHIGDQVKRGSVIGRSDTSGGATGPHLHFGYEVNGHYIDPSMCINSKISNGTENNSNLPNIPDNSAMVKCFKDAMSGASCSLVHGDAPCYFFDSSQCVCNIGHYNKQECEICTDAWNQCHAELDKCH